MNERFWEWLRQQYGDEFVAGWKRQVFPSLTGGIPKALEPAFEYWRRNIDTTPVTINPAIYEEAALQVLDEKLATGEIDRNEYVANQKVIKDEAKFPTISREALYLTEAEPIGEALVYEARAITHLDRLIKGGMISADDYEAQIESVSQVAATGRVDETAPLFKEAQNLPSQVQWEARVKEIESRIPETATPDERNRFLIEAQQRVGEQQAQVQQAGQIERERRIGEEFGDMPTGEPGTFLSQQEQARALELNAAGVYAQAAREAGSFRLIDVPSEAGDRLRLQVKLAKEQGIDTSQIENTMIGKKQAMTGEGDQMIGQRVIALINAGNIIISRREEQESSLLAKELPEGFKRFQRVRGEFIGGGTALESGDAGRTGFEGFTRFVEADPELKAKLTEMRAQRLSRFPILTSAFQQAPFEERKKGFSKFITSTPELRSQLEKRTRPSRTRQTSFRPFKGR